MTAVKIGVLAPCVAMLCGAAPASVAPLQRYIDQSRVLVISAPAATDPKLRRQDAMLGGRIVGDLQARDLVTIHAIGADHAAQALRRATILPADRFGVALIGKDGGIKLRADRPITAERLFAVIDAMPMRRAEIRSRRTGPQR